MQWIFVLCGCMFLLSLIATYQVCTVSLKAGLYTYNALEPTPNSLRSSLAPALGRGSPPALGHPERKQEVSPTQNGRGCCKHRQRMPSRGEVLHGKHMINCHAEEYRNGNIGRWREPHRSADGGHGEVYPLLSGGV